MEVDLINQRIQLSSENLKYKKISLHLRSTHRGFGKTHS